MLESKLDQSVLIQQIDSSPEFRKDFKALVAPSLNLNPVNCDDNDIDDILKQFKDPFKFHAVELST